MSQHDYKQGDDHREAETTREDLACLEDRLREDVLRYEQDLRELAETYREMADEDRATADAFDPASLESWPDE